MILKESVPNGKIRENIILDKVLTVSLIQSMFRVLASEFQHAQIIEFLSKEEVLLCRRVLNDYSFDFSSKPNMLTN